MIALICDDQKSVHTFFDNSVDWPALGIRQVLHARNGNQCLALIAESRPDILLLDIRMPGKTGLEVLREVQGSGIEAGTIILSAHGEFAYAQEALTLGAFDYELKPIDADKVTERIRILTRIQRDRYLTGLRNGLLGLADAGPSAEEVFARLQLEEYIAILITVEGDGENQVPGCLAEHYKFILTLGGGEFLVLYPVQDGDSEAAVRAVRGQFEGLRALLPGVRLRFSLSARGTGQPLENALGQCRQALEQGFFSEGDFHLFNGAESMADIDQILRVRGDIHSCLLNNSGEEKTMVCVDELFQVLARSKMATADIIDTCFEVLHYNISVILTESRASELELRRRLQDCKTLQELKEAACDTIRQRFFASAGGEVARTPLENVRRYLETSYAEQITLDSLAKLFFVSKYDLCRRFRQEFGEGIWDFLKRRRMEKAHALLLHTDLKIYEVAERVGYNDPNYFSNIYRKYYGGSPYQTKQGRAVIRNSD